MLVALIIIYNIACLFSPFLCIKTVYNSNRIFGFVCLGQRPLDIKDARKLEVYQTPSSCAPYFYTIYAIATPLPLHRETEISLAEIACSGVYVYDGIYPVVRENTQKKSSVNSGILYLGILYYVFRVVVKFFFLGAVLFRLRLNM